VIGLASSQVAVAVPEEYKAFVDLVAERWGYYFGKRAISKEKKEATKTEKGQVDSLKEKLGKLIGELISNKEADNRDTIRITQLELQKAEAELALKREPFNIKARPLNRALRYMDDVAIPKRIQELTGTAVTPRFQLSNDILKSIGVVKK
jgi:hypothetical protein